MLDTAEQLCSGTPASNVAAGGKTRKEKGTPPLAERSNIMRCLMSAEETEAAMMEAWEGTTGVGGEKWSGG